MSSGKLEAAPVPARFILLNDQPVGMGAYQDVLGTNDAAKHLAELIEASRYSTPFTLGVDAGWGMGKSSLMLQVQEQLKANKDSGIEPVWFNAWTAEGANALDGLIKSVLLSLDENVLRRGLRAIISRRQLIAGARIMLIIIASYFHLTRVADEIWNRLSIDARSRNNIRVQMAGMFQQWTSTSRRTPKGRTMVVFIDDLDRCSNDVILEICEAMKLYLDVEGIAFVIGCDQAVLGQAALSAERQTQNIANATYLEKIIQVTYTKPTPFDDQIEKLIDELADTSGTRSYFNDAVKRIVIDRTGRNPRRIKRLINSFVLEYSLDPGWADHGAEALIIVILMRQFYPDFYRVIADPTADNIAAEFLLYYEIRTNLKLGRVPSDEERQYFETHFVRPPGDQYSNEDLTRLEEELPVSFPALYRDSHFVSLLGNLSRRDDFERLRYRLQRHPIGALIPDQIDAQFGTAGVENLELAGMHILWIDDDPSAISMERAAVAAMGATVEMATTSEEARAVVAERSPDLIISDITRLEDMNAGLNDLRAIRTDDGYIGPAVFYTRRVTPSRQRAAESLGAVIVTSSAMLLEYLRNRAMGAESDLSSRGASGPRSPEARNIESPSRTRNTRDKANSWLTGEL